MIPHETRGEMAEALRAMLGEPRAEPEHAGNISDVLCRATAVGTGTGRAGFQSTMSHAS